VLTTKLGCLILILKCVYGIFQWTQKTKGSTYVSPFNILCSTVCRKVVSLSCSPTGSKFVYATSQAPSGGSRLSAVYLVQPWRPQDVKTNSGTLAVWDMKSNAKEVHGYTQHLVSFVFC